MTNHKTLIDVTASLGGGLTFLSQKKKCTKNSSVCKKCHDIGLVWELHAPSNQLLPTDSIGGYLRVVTRYMGSGIKGQKKGGITFSLSHDSSRERRCWIGHSRGDRPARNLAPRTIPSLPSISCSTIPRGQQFRFRSADWITTTSPTARVHFLSPCLRRWRSRKARKYSAVHRRHNASFVLSKNLARFLKSLSSSWCGGNSGRILVLRNSKVFGINVGSCTSSSW